jgi:hypothetical protein
LSYLRKHVEEVIRYGKSIWDIFITS